MSTATPSRRRGLSRFDAPARELTRWIALAGDRQPDSPRRPARKPQPDVLADKAGDYDVSKHPRHPKGTTDGGRFAPKAQGETVQFASPNVGEELSFEEVDRYARSPRYRAYLKAMHRIDAKAGVEGAYDEAFGAWTTGGEASVVNRITAARDTGVYVAALKGKAGRQLMVANFYPHENGPNHLYRVETRARSREKLYKRCKDSGIEYFTIVRRRGGATLYVIDTDGSKRDALDQLVSHYGATHIGRSNGWADFIGHDTDRDLAEAEYDRIIGAYRRRHRGSAGSRRNPARGNRPVHRRRSSPVTRKRADLDDEDDAPDPDSDWDDDEDLP